MKLQDLGGLSWAAGAYSSCRSLGTLLLFHLLLALLLACAQLPAGSQAIKLQPEGREKFYWSGEKFLITCLNNNNIKNVKIRWIGPNGLEILEDPRQRVYAASVMPHGHRLVVINATLGQDEGRYRCLLGSTDDRNPREQTEFQLKLYRSTSFKDTASHLQLATGQKGVLRCQVEFEPLASVSVSWHRDQLPIENFNDSAYQVSDYDPSAQLSELTIRPLTKRHDGIYTCRAFAETSNLSKISEHTIQLETNYAPEFDEPTYTHWVERQPTTATASGATGNGNGNSNGQAGRAGPAGEQVYRLPGNSRLRALAAAAKPLGASLEPPAPEGSGVRVELRCQCQANPAANILWTSSSSSGIILAKGQAPVVEDIVQQVDGHNTSSTLVISYQLDANWPHRNELYFCSASNRLGSASKTFKVEQGDPPPAFSVGPLRHYEPLGSQFRFTLLGPANGQALRDIVPQVDAFRIRAEGLANGQEAGQEPASSTATAGGGARHAHAQHAGPNGRRRDAHAHEPAVHVSLPAGGRLAAQDSYLPRNFTVNLGAGRIGAGPQRLYLEAHNAVGWSPNPTYLGQYNLVSGARRPGAPLCLWALLGACLLWLALPAAGRATRLGAARPTC